MNRDDLLKRCMDRRVAHETSVVAVSHLFYVYLLSALKRGQRVEIPNFGTFGTRMVGVKRIRKMPFFDPEKELADKVNERYHSLKSLLVGKYEFTSVTGEVEYEGKEAPYDAMIDQVGKEVIVDTYREVTVDKYQRAVTEAHVTTPPSKEKEQMPKFNLQDGETEGEQHPPREDETIPVTPPPTLHEMEDEGKGPSAIWQVLLALLVLAILTVALNYFGIIHLWGERPPEKQPEIVQQQPPPIQEETPAQPTPTPTPSPSTGKESPAKPASKTTPKPKPTPAEQPAKLVPPSGTGNFTIQVSSWRSTAKARQQAAQLGQEGFDAFIEDATVEGSTWHRVRAGRFTTRSDAQQAAERLRGLVDHSVWVTTIGGE